MIWIDIYCYGHYEFCPGSEERETSSEVGEGKKVNRLCLHVAFNNKSLQLWVRGKFHATWIM
jgi:hypothetical protein